MRLPHGSLESLNTMLARHKFKLTRYTVGSMQHDIALAAIEKIQKKIKVTEKVIAIAG